MSVLGFGGYFFRANDPARLRQWYAKNLGIGAGLGADSPGADDPFWRVAAGPVVFEPFSTDSDYFGSDKAVMINLRVSDLDGLIRALAASGTAAETRPEWDEPGFGRFARIHDPEGNPIELWEPPPE
jgi:catechol 2,3-dioxygenase-like lactoylglutathione lyase family enzyme